MQKYKIVKICNTIGLISIIMLIYWVVIFITITVFGLKVFKEDLTNTFYWSILGILALMFGALMINIMFNLSIVSEHISKTTADLINKSYRKQLILFFVSFPILIGYLFFGDWSSANTKQNYLISSAKYVINQYPEKTKLICNYKFDSVYLKSTEQTLNLLSRLNDKLPSISVIAKDTIDKSPVFLKIRNYNVDNFKKSGGKIDYIYSCSKEINEYLVKVFLKDYKEPYFISGDGNYQLYYPVKVDNKLIVLYFSEFQRYGKLGS